MNESPTVDASGVDAPTSSAKATHAERLQRMARATDFPFTYVVINPLNRALVRPLARVGVSPTALTFLSLAFTCVTALLLAMRASGVVWAGWVALLGAFFAHQLDALDGDLARYADRSSRFGGILDSVCDRFREMAWVVAVAVGALVAADQAGSLDADTLGAVLVPAAVCGFGAQLYFYAADGPIRLAERTDRQSPARWRFTLGPYGSSPTRIKLGLFEPYLYALPVATAVGLELWALWVFGVTFWLALVWKLARIR